MATWFLPQGLLRPHVASSSWLDEVRRHADRNHFATFCLLPFYRFGVPLQSFRDALVNHVSTHYADIGLKHAARQRRDRSHPLLLHRYFSQDAWDLYMLFTLPENALHTATPSLAHVDVDMSGQCAACLRSKRNATIDMKVRDERVPVEVSVACA
jgi:hypothetical protein